MANPKQEVKYTKLFLGNRFVDSKSGKTFVTTNPYTAKGVANISEGDKTDVDMAVEYAKKAFEIGSPYRRLEPSKRGRLLYKLADLLKRDMDVLVNLEILDTGKTLDEARREVKHAIDAMYYYAGWADKIYGKLIPADRDLLTMSRKEPIGIVGVVLPFDYPLTMLIWRVAPALATGNTLVIKPSSRTPLSALHFASLVVETKYPEGVINIIPGYGKTVGHAIVTHPEIRLVSFTGTNEIGKTVMEHVSKSTFKKLSLHLSGNNPLIVFNDVNLDEVTEIAHFATFDNEGQSPFAAGRIYVHEDIYDDFVKRSVDLARSRKVGNPFEEGIKQGPQIDEKLLQRVLTYIENAKKQGAKLEYGGRRIGNTGYFIEPTIFSNVTDTMEIAKEEVYGPVQVILKFRTFDEIVERANKSAYGMSAGILTRDLEKAFALYRRLHVGTVWINTYRRFPLQISIGGWKESGYGRSLGYEALRPYLVTKTALYRPSEKYDERRPHDDTTVV